MLRNIRIVLRSLNLRTYVTKPLENKQVLTKTPLISCKHSKFNQYQETVIQQNTKFGSIPLASSGWQHYKSKGDHFTIHPTAYHQFNMAVDKSFTDFELNDKIIENLKLCLDVTNPSDIQCSAIPRILGKDHTLIAAETGCGKTLAYLIPIVQQILLLKERNQQHCEMNTPFSLILTPGRELATQIGVVAEKLCSQLGINVKTVVGGNTKRLMYDPEFDQTDILIGSIGAISKLVTTKVYRMHNVRHVVIDEADTLLDDSFNDKLVYVLKRFPFHRNHTEDIDGVMGTQMILASATMPTNLEELLQTVVDPSTIYHAVSLNLHRILPNVTQKFMRMSKMHRPIQMLSIIKKELDRKRPVIVFSNKTKTSDFVSMFLNDHGIENACVNGDTLVKIKAGQFAKFQNGELHVLSTTDIVSRGLDTKRVRHVINFDFPTYISDYIHRVGRIGRINSHENCVITNFVSNLSELKLVRNIEHTARTAAILPGVNANITNIISERIIKEIEQEENKLFKS